MNCNIVELANTLDCIVNVTQRDEVGLVKYMQISIKLKGNSTAIMTIMMVIHQL